MMNLRFICCNNLGYKVLPLIFKICQQLRRNGFSHGFLYDCEAPRSPSHAHLWISKISNDVTNTALAERKTQHQLSGCEVSIFENDGISMLQSFLTNSPYRLARATKITELTLSAQQRIVNVLTTALPWTLEKTFLDVSHWLFLSNKDNWTYDSPLTFQMSIILISIPFSGAKCLKRTGTNFKF
jgi:hypothetical protein